MAYPRRHCAYPSFGIPALESSLSIYPSLPIIVLHIPFYSPISTLSLYFIQTLISSLFSHTFQTIWHMSLCDLEQTHMPLCHHPNSPLSAGYVLNTDAKPISTSTHMVNNAKCDVCCDLSSSQTSGGRV